MSQLSLFEPDDSPAAAPKRRRAAKSRQRKDDAVPVIVAGPAEESPITEGLFAPPPAPVPAPSPLARIFAARLAADPLEDAVRDEDTLSPCDPTQWVLDSESGNFVHRATGEVRDADDVTFAAPMGAAAVVRETVPGDVWDESQDTEDWP